MARLRALALSALVAGVVVGCGGGGTSSTTSTTSSAVTQTLGTTTASSATTTSAASRTTTTRTTKHKHRRTRTHRSASHTTTTLVAPTRVQLGMALCERNVAQSNVLTAAERSQLDSLCRLAWTGHLTPAAFAAAQRRLCGTMVADSGLVGAAATAAEQSCELGG